MLSGRTSHCVYIVWLDRSRFNMRPCTSEPQSCYERKEFRLVQGAKNSASSTLTKRIQTRSRHPPLSRRSPNDTKGHAMVGVVARIQWADVQWAVMSLHVKWKRHIELCEHVESGGVKGA
jgi:hypothetical protein